jgi:serine/threonine protein kinase/CRP-like cAMP-binding protein
MGNAASGEGDAAPPAGNTPAGAADTTGNTPAASGGESLDAKVPNSSLPNHGPDEGDEGNCSSVRRQMRIYEKHNDDVPDLKEMPVLSEKQSKIINHTLSHLFYSSNQALSEENFEFLLRRMTRVHFNKNKRLVSEGEEAKEMIIIEEGTLQITMGGRNVRVLEPGNLFGELALIFNAPRGATVDAITDGFYWTLSRDDFKRMQRKLASEVTANYIQIFQNIPYVTTCLQPHDLSILMQDLIPITYEPGEKVYTQDDIADKVIIIDEGIAEIQFTPPEGLIGSSQNPFTFVGLTVEKLETEYGIYGTKFVNDAGETENSVAIHEEAGPKNTTVTVVTMKHGTVIMGPLWCRAMLCEGWVEKKLTILHAYKDKKGHYAKSSRSKFAPHAPFSVLAKEDFIKCSHFTLGQFESKIGKISEVFQLAQTEEEDGHNERDNEHHQNAVNSGMLPQDSDDFHHPAVIPGHIDYVREFNTGCFSKFKYRAKIFLGFVGIAETTVTEEFPEPIICFLKIFNKNRAALKKQAHAAIQEVKILSSLENPFIMKCLGKYQEPGHLVAVLEYVNPPEYDLFSRIYSDKVMANVNDPAKRGLPNKTVMFYTANILLALAHMHARKIAFRNLKPENCMIDKDGYIKLVGMGFAKRIPFKYIGELQSKSYTLCGTPEYLAPELVLNSGHDHQVDMWALGVLVFEMCACSTPFKSTKDDVVEIISRITATRKKRIQFHHQLDTRSHELKDFAFKCFHFSPVA